MISEQRIRDELDAIIDPCSAVAGVPAGLVSMGLVRDLRVDPTGEISLTIGVTEPTCLMGWPFAREAEERLGRLPGVRHVSVKLDNATPWTPDDMSPAYSRRLRAARRAA
jgi:metal-sulfur cluster biosynthetic enzyme